MKHIPLNHDQRMKFAGMTDLFVVTHEDLTTATVNTPQAIVLDRLLLGDVVHGRDVFYQTKTPFAGLATCTMSVGLTGALTQFTLATSVLSGPGATALGSGGGYSVIADIDLVANFVGGAAEGLLAANAGEVLIWFRINRLRDRLRVQYAAV